LDKSVAAKKRVSSKEERGWRRQRRRQRRKRRRKRRGENELVFGGHEGEAEL